MRITYLGNSGFALEKDGALAIIDCYNPGAHAMLSEEALQGAKAVTALISHHHGDHFSRDILRLRNTSIVASFDVSAPPNAISLNVGARTSLNGMQITAYGSTDEGISFHIVWGETSIFHAGDLNDWHWRDEGGDAYARDAEAKFMIELERVQQGVGDVDLAFFPVDPRMGNDYYRGAILFAQAVRPRYFVPMHFGPQFNPPQTFFDEIAPFTTVVTDPVASRGACCELPL